MVFIFKLVLNLYEMLQDTGGNGDVGFENNVGNIGDREDIKREDTDIADVTSQFLKTIGTRLMQFLGSASQLSTIYKYAICRETLGKEDKEMCMHSATLKQ